MSRTAGVYLGIRARRDRQRDVLPAAARGSDHAGDVQSQFGAVSPSVDGGRDVAGGFGRGAIQIGGTALDSSDGKGHEDAEHQSGGRRASARHQHLAWVDPSCSEFRDHVPRSMINESWRDVQRCRSALWNDEFVARCAQCRDDAVKSIDGLRLVATAVVQKHDRSGTDSVEDGGLDGVHARLGPIPGVDAPAQRLLTVISGDRDDLGREVPSWRPVERHVGVRNSCPDVLQRAADLAADSRLRAVS
jgi:hypothetical protein